MAKTIQTSRKSSNEATTPKKNSELKAKTTATSKKTVEIPVKVDPNALDIQLVKKMIEALKRSESVQSEGAPLQLLEEDSAKSVSLQFSLNQVPAKSRWSHKAVELPHPIYSAPRETCVIVKHPQRTYKDLLIEHPVAGVTKVIGIDKLRKNYKSEVQKRELCNAFDLFVCDIETSSFLPEILGPYFFKRSKMPYALKFNQSNFCSVLEQNVKCTFFRVPRGDCMTVKIGHLKMETDELVENALSVFSAVQEFFSPKSEDSIARDLTVIRATVSATNVLAPLSIWLNKTALLDGVARAQQSVEDKLLNKKALKEENAKKLSC